jgi:hypothetical protein
MAEPTIMDRVGGFFASAFGLGGAPDATKEWWWRNSPTSLSSAGIYVDDELALQLDTVQSILERLGGTISTLPLMVFKRTADGGRETARDHPLYRLLHTKPNARQTFQEFWQEAVIHLAFWRNIYALIEPGQDYAIGGLTLIHPTRLVKIEQKPDGWLYYTFQQLPPSNGKDVYREDQLWHIRKPRLTVDGLRGMSMTETSRETFGRAIAVEQFGSAYFKNGGSGGGVLTHPGNFKDKDAENDFMTSWRAGGTGVNRHRDRLLKYGITYTPFTVKNDDAQFLDTLKEVTIKLCRLWNMPPHMVGSMDRATFSNIEQQSVEFVVYTLGPWINALEQACARDLVVGQDADAYFVEFNVSGLLRGDFKTRMDGYAMARQWGWLSVNDIRRLENLPPIGDEGDRYLEPVNMRSAEAAEDAEQAAEGLPDVDEAEMPAAADMDPADNNNDPANAPEEQTDAD